MNTTLIRESTTALIPVVETAARVNSWRVIASIELPMRKDDYQNGYCVIERADSPFGRARRYGCVAWCRRPDGEVHFVEGEYDLTRPGAILSMVKRAGVKS